MRHSIAHAISACLCTLLTLLFPARGKRRKPCPTAPAPTPAQPYVSPWSRPWTSPTKEEAAELFRRQAEQAKHAERTEQTEAAWELRLQWERRRAATLATMGVDYPYTYEGSPFTPDDFRTSA